MADGALTGHKAYLAGGDPPRLASNRFFYLQFLPLPQMKHLYQLALLLGLLVQGLLRPAVAVAAPFTPGNIVIARVGDGKTALTTASTAVFLDEYTLGGVLVQSVALPTAATGRNHALTATGSAAAEMALARTADGQALVLAGYSAVPGIDVVANSSSTTAVRVVGLVGANGSINTSTTLGSAFSGTTTMSSAARTVASDDGSSFYVAGTGSSSNVQYVPLGGSNPLAITSASITSQVLRIANGDLYLSAATSPDNGVSQVGSGLPTTGGQPVTLQPGFGGSTTTASPSGLYFADLSQDVPGVDVVYIADDRSTAGGGIQKWSLVDGAWMLNGTIASPSGVQVRGLDGNTTGYYGDITISLVATSPTSLFILSDYAGYNVAPTITTLPSAVATAPANTAFRGTAFAPESSTVVPAIPTIVSFTPTSGLADGTVTVTVTGTDFTNVTAVTLNGVAISGFTVVNNTTIIFTVPLGATSGPIAVTTPTGTATSTDTFTVTLPVPTITSLTPTTTVAGSAAFTLTVNGTGFLAGSVVHFNGTALTTTFGSATQLTAVVPASAVATVGSYNVTAENPSDTQGGASAPITFTVTTPAPTIASFTPTSGQANGTVTVTIMGTNFTGATAVSLNGVAITGFTVVNSTTITFTVPAGATSGPIAVTTAGGTATTTVTSFMVTLPHPTITNASPATVPAGSASFVLTVTGTGFISGSVVNLNGTALATMFVSATQLTATVPTSAVVAAGTYIITVANPSATQGGTSAAYAFTVTTAVPTITSFSPTSGQAGDLVTITGTNFTGATAVTINGAAITGFTIVNATTITFTVPTGASSGAVSVTTAGGTTTSNSTFTVIVPNPAPTITGLTPSITVAGSAGFTLTVNGTGFISTTVINFNGTVLATTFGSATHLTALVPASAVAMAGTYAVTVTNPAPGGGTSAAVTFMVTTPAPTIASFTPTSGLANGTVTVTITGTDFTGATAVTLNGVAIIGFTVVNNTTITFTVPGSATSGPIAVTTPTGTGTSIGTFTVTLPAPMITSLAPNTTPAGSVAFTLTVNGTGFLSGSVVSFNGAALTTTFVSATQLTAAVPVFAVATVGTYNVTVVNPSANQGGTSAAATFTVTTPAPTITSFTPTTGGPGVTVTLTGTNLMGATAVRIGTFAVTNFTVVSGTSITFVVPSGAGSVNGFISVTTPGGTATSTTLFNLVLATLAANALPGLTVFPNPATDRLTIKLPTSAAATVALRDLAGRLVLAPLALGADHQLLLPASLASGVYLLEVRQGAIVAIRRIAKN
jgi:hypothetical protein